MLLLYIHLHNENAEKGMKMRGVHEIMRGHWQGKIVRWEQFHPSSHAFLGFFFESFIVSTCWYINYIIFLMSKEKSEKNYSLTQSSLPRAHFTHKLPKLFKYIEETWRKGRFLLLPDLHDRTRRDFAAGAFRWNFLLMHSIPCRVTV